MEKSAKEREIEDEGSVTAVGEDTDVKGSRHGFQMGNRKTLLAIIMAAVIILSSFSVFVYYGSDDDQSLNDRNVFEPEYNEKLVDVQVTNDSIQYTYSSKPKDLNYTVGSYIVGPSGMGYLRKVTDLQQEGSIVTVETEQATIAEVIEEGDLFANETLDLNGSQTRASFTLELDKVLYSAETDTTTTEVRVFGDITIESNLVFKLKIESFKLQSLEFYIENGCSYNLGFEATHQIILEAEKELFSKNLPKIKLMIGWLPVYITPEVSFSVGAELQLTASLTTSVGGSLTTRAGIMYKRGDGWSPVAEFERESYFEPPSLDLSADATVYAVTPKMVFYIYGVIGPSFELRPYINLYVAPFDNPWWTLSLGLQGFVGIEIEVFDKELVSESFQLFDLNWVLAEAPLRYPPDAPTSLVSTPGIREISLSWDEPSDDGGADITGYNIYSGTSSAGKSLLVTVTNTDYIHSGLADGSTHFYEVAAVNVRGEGAASDETSATTFDVPGTPRNLVAIPGNGNVTLSWDAPSYDGNSPITGYNVYRGGTSGAGTLLDTLGTVLQYTDTDVDDGTLYFYQVSAFNDVGEGDSSDASATTFDIPSAAINLVLTPGDTEMVLDWEAPTDDGGTPVTNYRIYRGTSIGNESFLVQLGTVFNYTDTNLTNNQTYYYRVSAINEVGEGSLSNEAWATPSPTIYPPTEPQNLVATPGLQSIILEWNPPMSNGGAPVTNYTIYRNGTFLVTIGNVLTYNDTGLTHGQTCSYTVAAVNDVGEGNQSAQVNCTTFDIPDAPENATAQPRSEKVILKWQCPVDYGRTNITEYLIYRGIVSGSLSFLVSAGTNLTYTDTNLTDYQTYYYTVSAVNMIGEGPQCGELSATPVPPVHNIDVGTHFYTITDAIADVNTTNGHTITVDAGVYTESDINVNKSLNIIGEGRDVTTIDGFLAGRIIEISADWVNFTGFTVINSGFDSIPAIFLNYANHSTIEANNISSNDFGISVYFSNFNTIANNTFMGNNLDVRTRYSINNTFTNNTINNSGGFSTNYDSVNNTFTGNAISNSSGGFYFYDANNNSVINNTLSGNADGVFISWLCANITVYHNNFLNNTNQATDLEGINHWNNGYPDGGNFWSNYSGADNFSGPGQSVPGSDGIGDTPFIIANGNQDSYPLMAPWP